MSQIHLASGIGVSSKDANDHATYLDLFRLTKGIVRDIFESEYYRYVKQRYSWGLWQMFCSSSVLGMPVYLL